MLQRVNHLHPTCTTHDTLVRCTCTVNLLLHLTCVLSSRIQEPGSVWPHTSLWASEEEETPWKWLTIISSSSLEVSFWWPNKFLEKLKKNWRRKQKKLKFNLSLMSTTLVVMSWVQSIVLNWTQDNQRCTHTQLIVITWGPAVVVNVHSELPQNQAIVVIWLIRHSGSGLVRALSVEDNDDQAPGVRKFEGRLVVEGRGKGCGKILQVMQCLLRQQGQMFFCEDGSQSWYAKWRATGNRYAPIQILGTNLNMSEIQVKNSIFAKGHIWMSCDLRSGKMGTTTTLNRMVGVQQHRQSPPSTWSAGAAQFGFIRTGLDR